MGWMIGVPRQQKWCCALGGECMEQTGGRESENEKWGRKKQMKELKVYWSRKMHFLHSGTHSFSLTALWTLHTHLSLVHGIHSCKLLGDTSASVRNADCISLRGTICDVSQYTTLWRQLAFPAPQLTGVFEVGGEWCVHWKTVRQSGLMGMSAAAECL
jgi:hypothetical protein